MICCQFSTVNRSEKKASLGLRFKLLLDLLLGPESMGCQDSIEEFLRHRLSSSLLRGDSCCVHQCFPLVLKKSCVRRMRIRKNLCCFFHSNQDPLKVLTHNSQQTIKPPIFIEDETKFNGRKHGKSDLSFEISNLGL